MASIRISTQPIPRADLAKFFPDNPRLVRLLENLAQDVTINIPDATDPGLALLDEVQQTADFAASIGRLAQGIAIQALALAQANDAPPAAPAVTPEVPFDLQAQVSALRDRVAVLEAAVAQTKEGPSP